MKPRDPNEPHRAASPLELFFDLVFVVAVAFSSAQLHHMETHGHAAEGVVGYLMIFFAIWWAWMNFTWFATSFGTDDWLYRVLTVLQMGGVLILAAGASRAMEEGDFSLGVIGYIIMRLALVGQWLRAAANNPEYRPTAYRYAIGIVIIQVMWVGYLFVPKSLGVIAFIVLALIEISVPLFAESKKTTPWNAHHITERYGLFTLILLGESILASTNAVVDAIETGHHLNDLLIISGSGLLIAAGMWWVYFAREHHEHIDGIRSSVTFGYFHYFIFAAAGAFSAGIEVAIDYIGGEAHLNEIVGAATLSVPVAVFFLAVWWLTLRKSLSGVGSGFFLLGVAVMAAAVVVPGVWSVTAVAVGAILSVVAVEVGSRAGSGLADEATLGQFN
ncbi:low temperature requirement protein A [Galactobacter caseinivorans]|uniref:Low temperature requirement protein A n=2 Tax=Galactobacter caseinivorans TaxID=2676123 RepID=A0A496PG84_9MICC|nr:low temperature requirement protein A [Galactobacter caseinivorans]